MKKDNKTYDLAVHVVNQNNTKGLAVPCACDNMTVLFPEYHWPHCKKNPAKGQR